MVNQKTNDVPEETEQNDGDNGSKEDTSANDGSKGDDSDEKNSEEIESTPSKSTGVNKDITKQLEGDEKKAPNAELKQGGKVVVVDAKGADQEMDLEKRIKAEVDAFVRNVTLGQWLEVKKFLGELTADEADKVYAHLLKSLATAPKATAGSPQPQRGQLPAVPHLTPSDILQLADASPKVITLETKKKKPESDGGDAKDEDESKETAAAMRLPTGVTIQQGVVFSNLNLGTTNGIALQSGGITSTTVPSTVSNAETTHIASLAKLISNSRETGHDFTEFLIRIENGTRHFGGADPLKRLTTADLFLKSGMTEYVEEFLPELSADGTDSNLQALKIWSQLAMSMHDDKKVAQWLEKAWEINQWILGIDELEKADKDLALSNLIELSPKIEEEIGVAWMNASFTEEPERGMTILTNLGTKSAELALKAAQTPAETRFKLLRLQNDAVEKLIKISPETAQDWKQTLTLLAQNWLTETATSLKYSQQNSRREHMQIDMFGNYYWVNGSGRQRAMGGGGRQPLPIRLGDILEVAPNDVWRNLVDPSIHTNLRKTQANLLLRVNEEDKAFPYIEEVAQTNPKIARDLIHEFLRIWTNNHDPNSSKRRRNPYIYFYGFDRKAEAIPLTRSKQERNLQELAGWVQRIRELPIDDIDEKLLAGAFTTCHSSAEVFKIDRFRSVFGDLGALKPETIAAMCEKMRENLSSNWRDIRNQEEKQTKRREPDVQKAVLGGYETGLQLVAEALAASPENWKLHLAKATLQYDLNAYSQTVQKSSEFSDRRDAAFDQFKLAADKYESVVATLEEKDQSTEVFDFWFYAGLGACDLGKVTNKTVPDLRQYRKIREAIESLPGSLAESHMAKFANNLFTRMSPIKPEIKFRYLRGGFEIAGDHPRAWEASNLYDYYKDLVSEIKFSVVIDGEDNVGHGGPFGAYVNILHTSEIEREAGGFGKYVQNQNAMMYAYNYGRPTENYRDKFTDSVELALGDHFEVLNVTFQGAESMKSRPAAQQPGWRVTSFAYLLLKPKGPEVDRIAPLKLDMDFLDTSGYVVIPIESPALIVDCSAKKRSLRPISDLEITQTLDERQADDGKLIVEISASGKGLVPDLDNIIDLKRVNFEVVSVDDQGVLPTTFDDENDGIQILSDRSWTVEYRAMDSDAAFTEFAFSEPRLEATTSKFQRYEDADLVEVARTVELKKDYATFSWAFLYWLIPPIVLGFAGIGAIIFLATRPGQVVVKRFSMPTDINPFTVLTLLKDIKARNGISNEKGIELQDSIHRIEERYFGDTVDEQPEDLTDVASTWLRRAR